MYEHIWAKKGHDKHIASDVPDGKTDVFSEKMS